MSVTNPTYTDLALKERVDAAKSQGDTVTLVMNGNTVTGAVIEQLATSVLNNGVKAVDAQDKIVAGLMGTMSQQTNNMTNINNSLQALNKEALAVETGSRGVTVSDEVLATGNKLLGFANKWCDLAAAGVGWKTSEGLTYANFSTDLIADLQRIKDSGNPFYSSLASTVLDKKSGLYQDAMDTLNTLLNYFRSTSDTKNPVSISNAQTTWNTTALYDCLYAPATNVHNTLVSDSTKLSYKIAPVEREECNAWGLSNGGLAKVPGTLDSATQAMLTSLQKNADLSLGGIDITKPLTQAQMTTLQKNLSLAQSSQGALNEETSLKLNEATSKRASVFAQLQTLLQALMQAQQSVARW